LYAVVIEPVINVSDLGLQLFDGFSEKHVHQLRDRGDWESWIEFLLIASSAKRSRKVFAQPPIDFSRWLRLAPNSRLGNEERKRSL
jgi:hypothetical protein